MRGGLVRWGQDCAVGKVSRSVIRPGAAPRRKPTAQWQCLDRAATDYDPVMRSRRLSHPALDFWIDVRVRQLNSRWLAVADLAGAPDLGVGNTPSEALWDALSSFRIMLRADLVADAQLQLSWV